jgi:uncharacterized membrane protein YbhN (UPF0104 family)
VSIDPHRQQNRSSAWDLGRWNLILFAGAAGLAALAAILLADAVGATSIVHTGRRLDPEWLAVCFAGQLVAYLGYVLAVRDMARVGDGPELGLSLTTRTVVAGFGVFAATHSAGGFAVDFWTLRRAGVNRREAIARVLGLGALESSVLAPAALISALVLFVGAGGEGVQDGITLPWLLVVPGFLLAFWLTSPKRSARLSDPGEGGRARQALAHAVAGMTKLRQLAASPRRHGAGLAGVSLYWFGDILCLWAALQAFGAHPSVPALIVAYATGYIATRRSLPGGGAGVVEVLMTFALVWVGVGFAPALLSVLVYRLFNFWLPIVPALAVLPTVKHLREAYREAERQPED